MEEKNEHISENEKMPHQFGREIPFDATTSFSLLGWIWGKLNKAKDSKRIIDLNLEE